MVEPIGAREPLGSLDGMVRIALGEQHRWIWPVHLPGWLAVGWQLAHPGPGASHAVTRALVQPALGEPAALVDIAGAVDAEPAGLVPAGEELAGSGPAETTAAETTAAETTAAEPELLVDAEPTAAGPAEAASSGQNTAALEIAPAAPQAVAPQVLAAQALVRQKGRSRRKASGMPQRAEQQTPQEQPADQPAEAPAQTIPAGLDDLLLDVLDD